MKKVYVSILERPPPNVFKFKVAATMKGSNFKEYVAREIVDLSDVDFFLIYHNKETKPTFLDETKVFSTFTEQKLRFRLVVRTPKIRLRTAVNVEDDVSFDLTLPACENIASLNVFEPQLYVLTFRAKGSTATRLVAPQKPLVFQGWAGEPLTLHRRIRKKEFEDKSPENVLKLWETCRLYTADGVVYFKKEYWGYVCAYQYLSSGKDAQNFSKQTVERLMPKGMQSIDAIFQSAKQIIMQNMFLSKESAMKSYIEMFHIHGTLCCHAEEVKFLHAEKKWHMQSNRVFYVSCARFLVTKDFNGPIVKSESITSAVLVKGDKEKVVIKMANGSQWVIKTENAENLKLIIEDAIETAKYLKISSYRLSTQWIPNESTESLLQDDESKSVIIFSDIEDSSDGQEEEEVFEGEDLLLSECCRISKFRDRGPMHGISEVIVPEEGQENEPYSIDNQYFRDLKVTKNLEFPDKTNGSNNFDDVSDYTPFMFSSIDPNFQVAIISFLILVSIVLFIKNL